MSAHALMWSAAALGAMALGGCSQVNNSRLEVAGDLLPAVRPESMTATPLVKAQGPSLTGVDRSHWDELLYIVPQDGAHHHPRFTTLQPRYADAIPRQRGEHPTAHSALDLSADHGGQFWEALSAPVWGAADVVLFIPRALAVGGPGAIVASPDEVYERAGRVAPPPLEAERAPIE